MYTYLLMLVDFVKHHTMHWYMIFITIILLRWLVIRLFARFYRPYVCENRNLFTSVIIPVVDEPVDLFSKVLDRIAQQKPNEIIVVINGPENPELYGACVNLRKKWKESGIYQGLELKILQTSLGGKRNAIMLGVRNSDRQSDVMVLVDSDTIWTEGTLKNLLMPFSADDRIGGVTTRQKIYKPGRCLVTMIAAILEEIRAEGSMKAMSVTGKVGCLPGRTIAFRTEIMRRAMHEFMTESFMGIHKEVSDDRSLTNITLKMGYRTVMQDTSVIYTDAPVKWKKFVRQQLRWAEGSQYNNLRMSPWMFGHAPLMTFIYWTDMLMPFLLVSTYTNMFLCMAARILGLSMRSIIYTEPVWLIAVLILIGAAIGVGGRNLRAMLQLPPYYILCLPVVTLVLSLVMSPIRIVGLMKCADGLGWGTRVTHEQQE
ncbi:MAG: glycosyltransferase [Clostridia bacterium]|nr:glycosyltransferase [Clostridia bacterium]